MSLGTKKASLQSLACAAWNESVQATYGLVGSDVSGEGCRVELFARPGILRSLGYAATAPFATDGGVTGCHVSAPPGLVRALFSTLEGGAGSHLLVKTREDLFGCYPQVRVDRDSYVRLSLALSGGSESLWAALDPKTRNQTRKGFKANPTVTSGGAALLPDFYRVISQCWRDHGTPMHSRRLFSELLERFGSEARLMAVYLAGKAVSAALLIVVGDTLHFPFAGTLKEYRPTCVNNVLYWSIIEWACSRHLRWFDMGRSPRGGGTERYKLSWGATTEPLYYNYFVRPGAALLRVEHPVVRWAVRAWKHLPVAVANLLGPLLISGMF